MGLHGNFAAKDILFGNKKLMAEFTVDIESHKDQVATLQEQGKTVNYLAVENKLVALVALLDAPKENSLTGIKKLEKMNIDAVMISGDTEKTVAAVATQLGIKRYYAEVMPEQKASIVRKLQEEGNIVAFVGDGINDAPALAQSDLAIGMGTGTDVAIETAEIVLVH